MKPAILLISTLLLAGTGGFAFARQITNQPDGAHLVKHQREDQAANAALLERSRRVEPLRTKAEEAVKAGKYPEAVSLLKQALNIQDKDGLTLLRLAEAYEKMGRDRDALDTYRLLVYPKGWNSSVAGEAAVRMDFVLVLIRRGQWSEAVSVFEATAGQQQRIDPRHRAIAAAHFDKQVPEFKSLEAQTHLVLGMNGPPHFLARSGADILAIKEFRVSHLRQAAKLEPRVPEIQMAYGKGLEEAHHPDEARKAYRKAYDLARGGMKHDAWKEYSRLKPDDLPEPK